MTLRQIKKERTRQLIADTALRLFLERGYDQTTIDEIAATAEVGTRTLYRYYPTKEDLLVKSATPGYRALVTCLCDQPDDQPLGDALYTTLARFCYVLGNERKRGLALRELIENVPSVRARVHDEFELTRRELAKEVRRRMGAPRTDPRPELAAGMLMVMVDFVIVTWASGRRSPLRVADQAADLFRAGRVPLPMRSEAP
ncbi:MAG TPA: TetR/AcrR family transcriptional regulator [Candidatus Dormibacteraeota bacterium]|nr:TetR/AcrR family transcriptional regulator [Candidatus Dormibacteraeota bacterium]